MKKIIERLYNIKPDKYLHFICGLLMSCVLCSLLLHALPLWISVLISLLASTLVNAAKEWIYDPKYGVPNIKDFYATEIGIAFGIILSLI